MVVGVLPQAKSLILEMEMGFTETGNFSTRTGR